ncbi:MAG: riboflavin synthase [Pirellulales bacterium]
MFTGLVETLGQVVAVDDEPPGKRIVIEAPIIAADADVGDSIAVNGCCLTLVACAGPTLSFDAGPETLSRTNLGALSSGGKVNLERSLKVGDRLGGHFVTGHIDRLGHLELREDDAEWSTLWFSMPAELSVQMVSKGSIAVDGVSLTLIDVEAARFSVQLIPHTLSVTTLGLLQPGDAVNLETDLLAKYAQRVR